MMKISHQNGLNLIPNNFQAVSIFYSEILTNLINQVKIAFAYWEIHLQMELNYETKDYLVYQNCFKIITTH